MTDLQSRLREHDSRIRQNSETLSGLKNEMESQSSTLREIRDMIHDALDIKGELHRLEDRHIRLHEDHARTHEQVGEMRDKLNKLHYPLMVLVIAMTVGGLAMFGLSQTEAVSLVGGSSDNTSISQERTDD